MFRCYHVSSEYQFQHGKVTQGRKAHGEELFSQSRIVLLVMNGNVCFEKSSGRRKIRIRIVTELGSIEKVKVGDGDKVPVLHMHVLLLLLSCFCGWCVRRLLP